MTQVFAAGVFGDKLKDPAVVANLQQAAGALQGFGTGLLSSPQVQAGLDQLLRIVGQMLQDQDKRDALKGAAATLVQTAGTVGSSLQNGNAKDAVKSGAGLLIGAVGSKLQSAGAQ